MRIRGRLDCHSGWTFLESQDGTCRVVLPGVVTVVRENPGPPIIVTQAQLTRGRVAASGLPFEGSGRFKRPASQDEEHKSGGN